MKLTLEVVEGDVPKITKEAHDKVAKTATATFRDAGDKLKAGARASIAQGGFSGRWQNAFRVNVYPKNGQSGSPSIFAFHKIKYAGQFEDPQAVHGNPLVWLPIKANLPSGQHWSPSLFTRTIGPLRGGRQGSRPILFGQVSVRGGKVLPLTRKGARARAAQKAWLPVFVGVASVTDPKRFNIKAVAEDVASQLAGVFSGKWDET